MATITPQLAEAVDFGFQPRLEAGMLYYKYVQDAGTDLETNSGGLLPGLPDNTLNFSNQSKLEFKDVLPFVSGGGTTFINRFYIDLAAQYAFDGHDTAQTRSAEFFGETPNEAFQFAEADFWDSDFNRIDLGLTVGYVLTENFAIYAGYKYAKTEFDIKRSGEFRLDRCGDDSDPDIPPGCVSAPSPIAFSFTEDVNLKFEQGALSWGPLWGRKLIRGFCEAI
jgi:hypothetical protein